MEYTEAKNWDSTTRTLPVASLGCANNHQSISMNGIDFHTTGGTSLNNGKWQFGSSSAVGTLCKFKGCGGEGLGPCALLAYSATPFKGVFLTTYFSSISRERLIGFKTLANHQAAPGWWADQAPSYGWMDSTLFGSPRYSVGPSGNWWNTGSEHTVFLECTSPCNIFGFDSWGVYASGDGNVTTRGYIKSLSFYF